MSKNPFSIAPGVIIEHVGDEVVVFTSESSEAIKLSGPVAQTVVAIQAGKAIDASATGVSDLVELGIVRSAGMSRRGLITAGAVGAGAGIAMLSMPVAAAASSEFRITSAVFEVTATTSDTVYTLELRVEFSAAVVGQAGPMNVRLPDDNRFIATDPVISQNTITWTYNATGGPILTGFETLFGEIFLGPTRYPDVKFDRVPDPI